MSDPDKPLRANPRPGPRAPASRRTLTDPARYALQMLDLLQHWGTPRRAVLRAAGLDEAQFARMRGDERLTMAQVEPLFTAARRLAGRSDLGFEFGRRLRFRACEVFRPVRAGVRNGVDRGAKRSRSPSYGEHLQRRAAPFRAHERAWRNASQALRPTAHGLLGYGLIGRADVDEAWRLAARQQHHLTESFVLHYERHAGGGRARFTPIEPMDDGRLPFNLELLAVSTLATLQMLLGGQMPPVAVRLSMPPPPHRDRYRELAPATFRFEPGAPPGVEVTLDARLVARPLPMDAPGIVAGVESHLSTIAPKAAAEVSWTATIEQMLRATEGVQLSVTAVAARLGVSARTVDRRLGDEGRTFAGLRDAVRHARACELLADPALSVAQVARRLGYRDAANFSRAFRRQADMPPSAFRRRRGHVAPTVEAA